MASFRYKVKDKSGRTIAGVVDAEDQRSAVANLQRMGYFVLDIREAPVGVEQARTSWNPARLFVRWFVNPIFAGATVYSLGIFYRQLATMMRSGLTLTQAMRSLRSQGGSRRLRKIAAETMEFLQSGTRLSDAFARYPWMFPELHISLLRAGEASGMLDKMIERIADYLEWEHSVRQKLRLVTLYPKILVLAVIFIPSLPILLLEGLREYLRATVYNLIPIAIVILALWAVYRILYQIQSFRYGVDMVKLAIPRIGNIVRMLALSKFYRVVSAMFAAGAPLSQGLAHAADASGNWFLATRLKTAIDPIERGQSLSESLERTGVLPRMALDMLATGEQTGNVDAMLDKVAEYTEGEAEVATLQSSVTLGVLLFLGMAAYIGAFVIKFYVGYFSRVFSQ
ncbi:MAG TPA: type II secretion system F family protein [Armatimonadota bacterium]|nr:type II secretion system F family protein [Armatimonadota bacterium]